MKLTGSHNCLSYAEMLGGTTNTKLFPPNCNRQQAPYSIANTSQIYFITILYTKCRRIKLLSNGFTAHLPYSMALDVSGYSALSSQKLFYSKIICLFRLQ